MLLGKTIDVADNQRALVYRKNRLEDVLEPGLHQVSQLNGKVTFDLYDISDSVLRELMKLAPVRG